MKAFRITNKWLTIVLHVAAWLIVFSLPYLLQPPYHPDRTREPDNKGFFYLTLITNFFWVIVFYLNAFVLTRRFIYRKKYLPYILTLIAVYCVIMLFHGLLFTLLIKSRPFVFLRSASFNFTTFLLTVAASIT